ncbi:DUF397 domain-containing protein [Streptomyces litchfieldiae]|uniref:DUF397 domain-containing protein n=1 Tax=Streptomyces litchfieldiae TaxID=3075543 RepID=A0ABU2MYZ7_9ACTN|nr:DUF397 domain-containing protein [Streptomyces sp. DSM 44938]MDT0346587.1 DUF397 domain-containing protein [Streptomyces sp. DSM 44938]
MSTTDLAWFKSSYSSGSGDDCVEVALAWHRSSHSNNVSNACVEVAACPSIVHIRDSKNKQAAQLRLSPGAWTSFISYAGQSRSL